MRRTFTVGATIPAARPSAAQWIRALERSEARLKTCDRSSSHVFGGHRRRCPWCARIRLGLPDPFPSRDGGKVDLPPPSWLERRWHELRQAFRIRTRVASVPRRAIGVGAWVTAAVCWGWVQPLIAVAVLLVFPGAVLMALSAESVPGRWWSPLRLLRRGRAVGRQVREAAPDFACALAAVAGPTGVAAFTQGRGVAGPLAAAGLALAPALPESWRGAREQLLGTLARPLVTKLLALAALVALVGGPLLHLY